MGDSLWIGGGLPKYYDLIVEKLIDIKEDGSRLNQKILTTPQLTMTNIFNNLLEKTRKDRDANFIWI